MHISIEGLDGVGKSTIASTVANRLDFTYIERPLQYLFDDDGTLQNYRRITGKVNAIEDGFLRMWFYSFGDIFLNNHLQGKNFITVRYFISTFINNKNEYSDEIIELFIKKFKLPDITFVLYANENVRKERMISRNPSDPDILTVGETDKMYGEIKRFLNKFGFNYVWIDTSNASIDSVVHTVLSEVKNISDEENYK